MRWNFWGKRGVVCGGEKAHSICCYAYVDIFRNEKWATGNKKTSFGQDFLFVIFLLFAFPHSFFTTKI